MTSPRPQDAPSIEADTGPKKRILLVDDQAGLAALLQRLLPGYEIRGERQSTDALTAAREWKPDLLLLDVDMPEVTGFDLASAFARDSTLCHLPVIFLSGEVQAETDAPVLLNGYTAFAKPFNLDILREHIEQKLAEPLRPCEELGRS